MREAKELDLMHEKERLVGLEFENPLVAKDGYIISQDDIQNFWNDFIKDGDEKDVDYFTKTLVGAKKKLQDGSYKNLNTDSGICTLEMSLSPKRNLYDAKKVFEEVRDDVLQSVIAANLRYLGYAIQPRRISGNPYDYKTKKSMYRTFGHVQRHNMQIPITAHQVGVSLHLSEVIRTTNALQAISGAVVCVMANSPIFEDKIVPWKETRLLHWAITSTSGRCQEEMRLFAVMPQRPFKNLSEYYSYAWSSPMPIPVLRNGQWIINKKTVSFIEYCKHKKWQGVDLYGKKVDLEPSVADLNLASICMWFDAKPHLIFNKEKTELKDFFLALEKNALEEYVEDKLVNCYMEFRACGSSPKGEELALPAFILGLVNNLDSLCVLVGKYPWEEWKLLRETSYVTAMESFLGNVKISQILKELCDISEQGLKKRKLKEEIFLEPIKKRIAESKCPADYDIDVFKQKGMEGFIDYISY